APAIVSKKATLAKASSTPALGRKAGAAAVRGASPCSEASEPSERRSAPPTKDRLGSRAPGTPIQVRKAASAVRRTSSAAGGPDDSECSASPSRHSSSSSSSPSPDRPVPSPKAPPPVAAIPVATRPAKRPRPATPPKAAAARKTVAASPPRPPASASLSALTSTPPKRKTAPLVLSADDEGSFQAAVLDRLCTLCGENDDAKVLAEYIVVMVAGSKGREEMSVELKPFFQDQAQAESFVEWVE
ncbi:unnamed protein product, partial [Polarella glacialis]